MKKSELKSLLKNSIEPKSMNVIDKIDLASIVIEPKERRRFLKFSPRTVLRLSFMLVLVTFLSIGLVNSLNDTQLPNVKLTSNQVYSFNAISSSVLLDSYDRAETIEAANIVLYMSQPTQTDIVIQSRMDTLNPYFNLIELAISEEELVAYDSLPSDDENYDLMATIKTNGLMGEQITYTYYYKEIINNLNINVIGKVIIDDTVFYLDSKKTSNNGVTIVETLTYRDSISKYEEAVLVKSIESSKQQYFEYTVIKNGTETENTELKLKKQNRNIRVELDYDNELEGIELSLTAVRKQENGKIYLDVNYEIETYHSEEEGKMIVTVIQDELTGENLFRYEIMNKNGDKGDFTGHKNPNRGGGKKDHDHDDEKDKGNQDNPGHKKMNRIGLL